MITNNDLMMELRAMSNLDDDLGRKIASYDYDRSDPTMEQVRLNFNDGLFILAAAEPDGTGWTACLYATPGDIPDGEYMLNDGDVSIEAFRRFVRTAAKG